MKKPAGSARKGDVMYVRRSDFHDSDGKYAEESNFESDLVVCAILTDPFTVGRFPAFDSWILLGPTGVRVIFFSKFKSVTLRFEYYL